LYAGGGAFDMAPVLATNERFARYAPLPSLMRPFLRLLSKPGVWVALADLLEMAGPEAEAALPYHGHQALLYFAQMQHVFVFSPERGGIVARRPALVALYSQTTPCPVFYNQLCRALGRVANSTARGRVHVDAVPALVEPEALAEMMRCFPSWAAFAAAHGTKFRFDEARGEVALASVVESEARQSLSLEEQLAQARRSGSMAAVKSLRRRIAAERNPDSPLLDPEHLAAAVAEFLPPVTHMSVAALLRALPDEMRDLLPRAGMLRFLKRFPGVFSVFDFRQPGVRHVQRAGLALPAGALRTDFSAEEVVALAVHELQRRGGRASLATLFTRMPAAVTEQLKKAPALAALLKAHDGCFVFVASAESVDVLLVKAPPFVAQIGAADLSAEAVPGEGGEVDEWVAIARATAPHA
jgi:hypothetical protein